ncbi:hypothetical protein AVEN_256570-1 [Araneus ventricosus]|uniref:Uncharacterized protein n=1 Tax=Araneus ventricosus TaxID=182803 RepID=A0A4Y2FNY8_ARAVE|nr:hypothetical protein AVEN_256570-1 [Araneus ventricosus]
MTGRTPFPNFRITPMEGRLTLYICFSIQRAQCTAGLQWNRVSNLEHSDTKTETLPLGHRDLSNDDKGELYVCCHSTGQTADPRATKFGPNIIWRIGF